MKTPLSESEDLSFSRLESDKGQMGKKRKDHFHFGFVGLFFFLVDKNTGIEIYFHLDININTT